MMMMMKRWQGSESRQAKKIATAKQPSNKREKPFASKALLR
jgi:hypothetical protein